MKPYVFFCSAFFSFCMGLFVEICSEIRLCYFGLVSFLSPQETKTWTLKVEGFLIGISFLQVSIFRCQCLFFFPDISHHKKKEIIDSNVPAGRGYVIVPWDLT